MIPSKQRASNRVTGEALTDNPPTTEGADVPNKDNPSAPTCATLLRVLACVEVVLYGDECDCETDDCVECNSARVVARHFQRGEFAVPQEDTPRPDKGATPLSVYLECLHVLSDLPGHERERVVMALHALRCADGCVLADNVIDWREKAAGLETQIRDLKSIIEEHDLLGDGEASS